MTNKEVVKEVVNAFLSNDISKAVTHMTDDVQMGWPGFFNLEPGKDAILNFFKDVPEMVSYQTNDLIANDNIVVGSGSITSKEKDGSLKNSFFTDWYYLENGKVKKIESYMVFENKLEATAP